MVDLQFVDQHNMVACLERTNGNTEFHQIVDFLTSSPIHYALTVSPTIYASYIEQFWATTKSKTVNDVKQIHATVDGKIVVITESSVRSDLYFNDEDGITCLSNDEIFENLALMGQIDLAEPFNDVYVTHVHTNKVFTNIKRKNKDFSKKITLLFAPMLVPQVVEGGGSGQPSEPQPPSLTAPLSHEEQVTTVASQPQKTHTPRRTKRGQVTKIPQSSGPPKKVGDKVVYTREDDRVVSSATTSTILEETGSGSRPRCQDITLGDADAQTRRSHTRSDEGRPNFHELMAFCIQLPNRVLTLEQSKTVQDLIGTSKRKSLDKENVSKQGKNLKTRIEEGDFDDDFDDIDDMWEKAMENVEGDTVNAATGVSTASASVTTASVFISTFEPRTPLTKTTNAFEDKDLTIAQTLEKMKIALLAAKLQEEEREQFSINEQAKFLVDIITEGRGSFTYNQLKNKSLEEIQKLYEREQKWINDFVLIDSEVVKDSGKKDDSSQKQAASTQKRPRVEHNEESVKKQKLEDDTEKEELRAYLDIVLVDDFAINVEYLVTKYPIVDWKTQILTENMIHDVLDLYRLVKQINETISPERYDILLWGDLITLFEPREKDEIWKAQQD
nr:xylulose kinase-1 [Tanacetum cinerariifolium]GEW40316.1 xylulose kinase-1 [Tanacetum cinerariifolium]